MAQKLNITVRIRVFTYFFYFIIVSLSALGQVKQKKHLSTADHHLWSTLELPILSSTGVWTSYNLRYASGKDTMFVRRYDDKKTYAYPLGIKGKFCGEEWYACSNGKDMILTNLKNGKREVFKETRDYEFSSNEKYLFVFSKTENGDKILGIRNLLNESTETIKSIKSWRFNQEKNMLAYCTKNRIDGEATVVSIQNTIKRVVQLPFSGSVGTNIVWQKNSASLVFVLQPINDSGKLSGMETKLAQFRFGSRQLLMLDPKHTEGFSTGRHIESPDTESLKISDDGKRIFFQDVPDTLSNSFDNPLVEVWHGDDKIIYSEQKQYGNLADWSKTAVWYSDENAVFKFMPHETHVMLSGDQKMALTSSLQPCELQFKYSPDRDYYLTDLQTRERKIWMHCHSPEMHHTLMSPFGKQLLFYQDGNWHAYSLDSEKQTNLTRAIPVSFHEEENDIGEPPEAYGLAGWTSDSSAVLLYDRYDLWEVAISGNSFRRLTRGREKHTVYRVAQTGTAKKQPFAGVHDGSVMDLNSELLLRVLPDDKSGEGYAILKNGKEKLLHFGPHRTYAIEKASDSGDCIFIQEDYKNPAALRIIKKGKIATVYQSNPHHYNYKWGNVVSVSYASESGKILKGLLYFPSDYEKGRKYPMIVRVYQKLQNGIHIYRNPADLVYDGFDLISFVNNGYFVLLPDMEYKMGRPGDSALFCTLGAVNAAVGLGDIDASKIGLAGHSFGGFEASYIVTKTNVFAAAVAGAAMTDLISGYLTVSENYKKAEFWRYEYYTNRIGKSLFEDFDSYYQNSSVFGTAKINTPLLLWTGENDKHVASTQSTELYLAMRRLGKKVTMLRYPKEDHNLAKPNAQSDLKNKVIDWFNYYLKDEKPADWIVNGVRASK